MKMKWILLSLMSVLVIQACQTRERGNNNAIDLSQIIRKSNVVHDSVSFQEGLMHVPPYLSNGILGGCFDHMGFQSLPQKGVPNGRTVLGYIGHYYMHKPTTRQAQLPLAYIQAEFADGSSMLNMMDTRDYRQELDIYTGVLTTRYNLFGETTITAFAHQTIPNLFVMRIDRKADTPGKELVVKIHCETASTQQSNIGWPPSPGKIDIRVSENRADIVSSTNMVNTRLSVLADSPIEHSGDQITLRLSKPSTLIRVLVHRDDIDTTETTSLTYDQLLASHTAEWSKNWERSWIDFPEDRAHHVWNRANYYNLSNFPVIPEKALIPTGMNTNIWGFTFPQDVYYVVENLTRSGHFDRYEKAMQYWLDILPEVKEYSRRTMKLEGGYYPWTPPFDQWEEYEKHGVVGTDSYQIHNPAYVSAMVWHYYLRTGNKDFLKKFFPIMEEVWRFYCQVLHENDRGTYDVFHHTATSQDEAFRETDLKNYLDASMSAEYSARNYMQAAQVTGQANELLVRMASEILSVGLERNALINEHGYWSTFEGDNRPFNSQKHPVQLNAITFCPMPDWGNSVPSVTGWEKRYDLTTEARKPISHGWTYAAFALASSRLGKPHGLASDLSAAQLCSHADPRWIQFYEFTFWERWTLATAYYFPTHGLYQQALTDAIVQDWQGYTEVFACLLDTWKHQTFSFKGMYTLGGVSVDGKWDKGKIQLSLHPNGASKVEIKVSGATGSIQARGDKGQIDTFEAGEKVVIEFEGNRPVYLTN